ncbi:MAG: hypothetical protein H6695_21115 [Deferribacteres bacterium]|nr:hypothetical protein [Deferribacteres bacterium]
MQTKKYCFCAEITSIFLEEFNAVSIFAEFDAKAGRFATNTALIRHLFRSFPGKTLLNFGGGELLAV